MMPYRAGLLSTFAVLAVANCAAFAADDKDPLLGLRKQEGPITTVPLGGLAGGAQSNIATAITNPKAQDVQAGRQLFIKLNCADCHGFSAGGSIGPSLVDNYWRYGGTPAQIFKSIYDGRPKGMPAWGASLSPNDVWQLVAYIESLGGAVPASDYQPAMQGDRVGEKVTPELDFEQELDGSPKYQGPSAGAGPIGEQTSSEQK